MIIRGVFSMSIINRLKSLFTGETDNEEKDISNDVSNTSDDVQVTSSQKVQDDVVSGTKTTVPREDVVKIEPEDDEQDLTDIETSEDESPEEMLKEALEYSQAQQQIYLDKAKQTEDSVNQDEEFILSVLRRPYVDPIARETAAEYRKISVQVTELMNPTEAQAPTE